MDVRCINNKPMDAENKLFPDLEEGNIYYVLGIEDDYYRLLGSLGRAYLYHKSRFEVINDDIEPDWITIEQNGIRKTYPNEFFRNDFFKKYFAGNIRERNRIHSFADELGSRRMEGIYDEEFVNEWLDKVDKKIHEEKQTSHTKIC